jgi:hypothetical protein
MAETLLSYIRPPAVEDLEIRVLKCPPNPNGWKFMWYIAEAMPENQWKILDSTGQNGHLSSLSMRDAFDMALRAYEAISLQRGG